MAYRKLTDIDDKILRAIWQLGAEIGAKKVTARKVGALCGVSDYTVFCHFGNSNRGFLDAAAKYFATLYLDPFFESLPLLPTPEEKWDALFNSFLSEPNGALYFANYCTSYGLHEDILSEETRRIAATELAKGAMPMSEIEQRIVLNYFLTAAFNYAKYFSRGVIPDTPEMRAFMRDLICRSFAKK